MLKKVFVVSSLVLFSACKMTSSETKGISAERNEIGPNTLRYLEFIEVSDSDNKVGICAYAVEGSYWFGSTAAKELEEMRKEYAKPSFKDLSKEKQRKIEITMAALYGEKLSYLGSDKVTKLRDFPLAFEAEGLMKSLSKRDSTFNGYTRSKAVRDRMRKAVLSSSEALAAVTVGGGIASSVSVTGGLVAALGAATLSGVTIIGTVAGLPAMLYYAVVGNDRETEEKEEVKALSEEFSSRRVPETRFNNILDTISNFDKKLTVKCPDLAELGEIIQGAAAKAE